MSTAATNATAPSGRVRHMLTNEREVIFEPEQIARVTAGEYYMRIETGGSTGSVFLTHLVGLPATSPRNSFEEFLEMPARRQLEGHVEMGLREVSRPPVDWTF